MPFDHARCPACQGAIAPEKLKAGPRGPMCPYCDANLQLGNLFGIKDAFSEEEAESLTLDDLVPGGSSGGGGGSEDGPQSIDNLLPLKR